MGFCFLYLLLLLIQHDDSHTSSMLPMSSPDSGELASIIAAWSLTCSDTDTDRNHSHPTRKQKPESSLDLLESCAIAPDGAAPRDRQTNAFTPCRAAYNRSVGEQLHAQHNTDFEVLESSQCEVLFARNICYARRGSATSRRRSIHHLSSSEDGAPSATVQVPKAAQSGERCYFSVKMASDI